MTALNTPLRRHWLRIALATALLFSATPHRSSAAPPEPVATGGFTLAVLPDTQMYAWKEPEIYAVQTRWINANAKAHNIPFVLHLGDITQHNNDEQWKLARQAQDELKIPCALLPGNHDLGAGGKADSRETLMTRYFPVSELKKWKTFGGVYDKEPERTENSFHRFEAGGRKWLVVALEFGPRNDVLRWAGDVAAKHPGHSVILITHAYLRPDTQRFDRRLKLTVKGRELSLGLDNYALSKSSDGFNDGEDIWQKLVSQHANFVLVISGHVCVTGRRTDTGRHGNPVHQMVVDYQNQTRGGNGFLRLLQFAPDGKTVRAVDYSPLLDKPSEIPGTDFTLELPPAPRGAE
jgi:hypothetical protein